MIIVFITSPILYFFYAFTENDQYRYQQKTIHDLKLRIGFDLIAVVDDAQNRFLIFNKIVQGSLAQQAGIKPGDALAFESIQEFFELLQVNQGKTLTFPVYRRAVKWDIQLNIPLVTEHQLYQGFFWSLLRKMFSHEQYYFKEG